MQIARCTHNGNSAANCVATQLLSSVRPSFHRRLQRQCQPQPQPQCQHYGARRAPAGYTLIELAIVVALVGILTAIAIPSYDGYITRTNRAEAKDLLSDVMFQQERFNTRNRRYTQDMTELGYDADPTPSTQGYYTVDAFTCAGEANVTRCVRLRATPVTGEAQEGDGFLELDSRGNRTPEEKWNK